MGAVRPIEGMAIYVIVWICKGFLGHFARLIRPRDVKTNQVRFAKVQFGGAWLGPEKNVFGLYDSQLQLANLGSLLR